MPRDLYSVRFLAAKQVGVWTHFTVPSGHRAVVRQVTVVTGGVVGDWCQVAVNGVNAFIFTYQAGQRTQFFDVRWTAYAGEVIEAYIGVTQVTCLVNGFLFVESSAAREALSDVPPGHECPEPAYPL